MIYFKTMYIDIVVPKTETSRGKAISATFYSTKTTDSCIPFRLSYCRRDDSMSIASAKDFMSYIDSKNHKYGAFA